MATPNARRTQTRRHTAGTGAIRFGRLVAAALALALSGCASTTGPLLADAVGRAYPGHADLQPKLAVGADTGSFPYTPGTLIFATASGEDGSAWTAETDFRCGHATPIGRFRAARLKPYVTGTGVAISAREQARDWLAASTGLSHAAVAGVSSVRIALTNVRRLTASRRDLERLSREAALGCPLGVAAGWKAIKSVLIGDVRVEIRFERHIDVGARLALLEALQLSFGVGYHRVSDRAIAGRQVAFGVMWQ